MNAYHKVLSKLGMRNHLKPAALLRCADHLQQEYRATQMRVQHQARSAAANSQGRGKLPQPPAGIRSASMLHMSNGGVPTGTSSEQYATQRGMGPRTASAIHQDIVTDYFDSGFTPPPPSSGYIGQDRRGSPHRVKTNPPPGVDFSIPPSGYYYDM